MVDGEAPVSIGSWEIHSWRVAAAALAALAPLLLVRLQIANVANVKMMLTLVTPSLHNVPVVN